ncbi:hypothetical protein J4198_005367 [Salmonella enterica]|nr:hypothetical protein [Salmonella enterica]EHG4041529.1 hypothetical protein [Salmonella enterica]EHG6848760.1 hypothetical protein [Salmonella enterica]
MINTEKEVNHDWGFYSETGKSGLNKNPCEDDFLVTTLLLWITVALIIPGLAYHATTRIAVWFLKMKTYRFQWH